jgi:hypothetical protein
MKILWLGVTVTHWSHKSESAGSNLVAATNDDLAQLAEHYADTVEVDSSILSVITIGSVAQLDRCTRLLTGGFWVRIPAELQREYSFNGRTVGC